MRVWSGTPLPLGATFDGGGVNFALFSEHATGVDLCLFDRPGARAERQRVSLVERTDGIWHGYVPDLGPGQLYGYRIHGPWDPAMGHRFNPTKVLLDPYARAFGRELDWDTALFGFERGTDGDGPPDLADSAPFAALGVVTDHEPFDWAGDRRPARPWSDTVLYEAHVKGATALHEGIAPALRGKFLGLAAPAFVEHLQALGVTALELLPIHAHADEWEMAETARTNYWGYNTLSFFAPDARFATSPASSVREFKMMVRALHAAGIEVILDVVYNHTAEGSHLGPTLSWRGIDNRSYYRLDPARPSRYENFSGCGNTLDIRHPRVLQLVMDSLRYWVAEMHVDGFRFDLATTLARDSPDFNARAPFLQAIAQDPVLAGVKLIAEPWDIGPGGFRLGQFPAGWREWNGYYRDDIRRFWRGDSGLLSKLAYRLAGSSDLYRYGGRGPTASINYVVAHDGFTLADLVAYQEKHNDANGEDNRDGETNNFSWNCGVEGPTTDAGVLALRDRHRRNLLATLFVSLGVPMLSGGDEVGRTQAGNNNAYCQDSPLSWTPWVHDDRDRAFLTFARDLVAFRLAHPVFRRTDFLNGAGQPVADVHWLRPEGGEMTAGDWADADRRVLGMMLNGRAIGRRGSRGEPLVGATLLVLLNASEGDVPFMLPTVNAGGWVRVLDTTTPERTAQSLADGPAFTLVAQSVVVLEHAAQA